VAVTVVDEWHRRGLATTLIAALVSRAVDEGIHYFRAEVAADNLPSIRLLKSWPADVELVDQGHGVLTYEISWLSRRVDQSRPAYWPEAS
jgi:ribosomal protein S18 acetylase RimI-like enzyme